jgi:hypothetical protein
MSDLNIHIEIGMTEYDGTAETLPMEGERVLLRRPQDWWRAGMVFGGRFRESGDTFSTDLVPGDFWAHMDDLWDY